VQITRSIVRSFAQCPEITWQLKDERSGVEDEEGANFDNLDLFIAQTIRRLFYSKAKQRYV